MKTQRKLLPAGSTAKRKRNHNGEQTLPPTSSTKRQKTRVACNRCRERRTGCDGQRPICTRCSADGAQCIYLSQTADETISMALKNQLARLREESSEHVEILKILRTAPEPLVPLIIRRLRDSASIATVLSEIKKVPLLATRPSDIDTARAISPPTESGMAFELSVLHAAYAALEPLDLLSIDLENLLSHRRLSSDSLAPGAVTADSKTASDAMMDSTANAALRAARTVSPLRNVSARRTSEQFGPFKAQSYCDDRLNELKIQYWTAVPISNEFAAQVISAYLLGDHAITGYFDADLFLDDLIHCRLENCSAFLTNALLCMACLCFAGVDSRATALAIAFFRETEILWHADRFSYFVTTISAMNFFALAASQLGKDQFAIELVKNTYAMAKDMKLLDVPHTEQVVAEFRSMPPRKIRALAHVAWGTYGWLTFHATFFHEEPIAFPPALPIPGDDGRKATETPPLQWPLHPLPIYMGHTFASLCKFWTIIQEVLAVYLRRDELSPHRIPLAFAEMKYQKLLAWADDLNAELLASEQTFAHTFIFQGLYHIAVLDIFRPLLKDETRMFSFTSADSTPQAAFNASLKQLERLLFTYRSRLHPTRYSTWLNCIAIHIGNVIIRDIDNADWHFYFSLCMGYWKATVICFPVFTQVVQAILSIALEASRLTSAEVRDHMDYFQQRVKHHEMADMATSVIIDFERATSANDQFRSHELARRFDELVLFNELTTINSVAN